MARISVFTLTILFSFQMLTGKAQNSADSTMAANYYRMGDSLVVSGDYEQANLNFAHAAAQFEQNGSTKRYLDCISKIADNLFIIRNLDQAFDKSSYLIKTSIDLLGEENLYQSDGLFILGKIDLVKQQSDFGLASFNHALSIRKQLADGFDINIVKIYNAIGGVYFRQGDFDTARKSWENAIASIEENVGSAHHALVNLYMNIGSIYNMKGEYTLALEHFQKSLAVAEDELGERHGTTAILYNNIGNARLRLGFYDSAIDYFQKSLAVNRDVFGEDYINLAPTYNNLGKVYSNQERYELALQYMEKALAIFVSHYGESNPDVAATYASIGQVYVNFDRKGDEALNYLFKAVDIYTKLNISQYDLAATYSNIATELFDRGDYEKALGYCGQAYDIWESIDPGHPEISEVFAIIGEIHRKQKNFSKAIKNHQRSIKHFTENVGEKHPSLVRYHLNLGITFQDQGNYSTSLNHFQNALVSNFEHFNDSSFKAIPPITGSYDPFYLLRTLHGKAISLSRKAKNGKDDDLRLAIDHYLLCDTLMDNLTLTPLKFQARLKFEELRSEIYSDAIDLAVNLYDETSNELNIDQSFYFVEKSKVRILSESNFDKYAREMTFIPDTLLQKQEQIGRSLSYYQTLLNEEPELMLENDYKTRVFRLERSQDSLVNYLEANYPKYFQLKYNSQVLSYDKIASSLDEQSAVIEYFLNDNTGYIFLMTKSDFSFYKIEGIAQLIMSIDEFRKALHATEGSFELSKIEQNAKMLHHKLIAPVLPLLEKHEVNKLIIVSDKGLSYLPFGLLMNSTEKSVIEYANTNGAVPPYLIRDYAISYAYSSTLHFQEVIKNSSSNNNLISFAPTFTPLPRGEETSEILPIVRNLMVPLDWNTKEVTLISEYFSNDTNKGASATETKFKKSVNEYDIIHLATHAIVDDDDPMNSKMIFYQNSDSLEDGFLHAFELYNMKLSANLAVLSACQTGYGKLVQGEGIISLGRGFAYAGVPSVVMSHWQVDDQSTSILMKHFYENLYNGYSKSEALRQAKLKYLQEASPNKIHPFFWGAFVVIGDDTPVVSTGYGWKYFLLVGLIAIIMVVLVRRKSKMTND